MIRRRQVTGSLLIELLVVCALIALFLPFVVSALARMQERHLLGQTYQDQQAIRAAIDAHFQSQWSRLTPASCRIENDVYITIESGRSPPPRLDSRQLDARSDWISGTDYGLCRGTVSVKENPLETSLACHWKAGDRVRFSSCDAVFQGQILSASTQKSTIQLSSSTIQLSSGSETDIAIGQSGIIESQDGFYWYISEGKDGRNAFWRTPEESGNALELWNGIERLSVFPLLDTDQDGKVEALDTRYGDFALNAVRGVWVEYQYQLNDCQSERHTQFQREYRSMRGDVWRYASPCQGVGNHLIVLK